MAEPGSGSMWLTRDDDVVTHLYFAAAEIGKASMEIGGLTVSGSLSFPNGETRTISFFSDGDMDLSGVDTAAGAVVRMEYSQDESSFVFLSNLTDLQDQGGRRRWRVNFPTVVERNQRRIVRRHRVFGRSGYSVMVDMGNARREKAVMYDVSGAGVSFVVGPTIATLKIGADLTGTVSVPGCDPIATMLELRNLRPLPGDSTRKLAGCRFMGMGLADQEALARALARLD